MKIVGLDELIKNLGDINSHVRKNLILESEYIRNKLIKYAPEGVTGHLKKSFFTKTNADIVTFNIGIYSKVPYSEKQAYEELMHIPENKLGKLSFSDYSSKWHRTKTPKKLHERKNEKRKNSKESWKSIKYSRGYTLAKEGHEPSETYITDYIDKAFEAYGGIEKLLNNIMK